MQGPESLSNVVLDCTHVLLNFPLRKDLLPSLCCQHLAHFVAEVVQQWMHASGIHWFYHTVYHLW